MHEAACNVKHTRIVVVGRGLALDIVGELAARERDLEIVKRLGLAEGPLQAQALADAHVVVTSLHETTRASAFELLAARPGLRILAISADGGEGRLYELRPHERALGEVSNETLLAAIRRQLPDEVGH